MADLKVMISAFDVPEVRAELERLRGLIKEAEWADGTHDAAGCPWCVASGAEQEHHEPNCRAFTPEGEVR